MQAFSYVRGLIAAVFFSAAFAAGAADIAVLQAGAADTAVLQAGAADTAVLQAGAADIGGWIASQSKPAEPAAAPETCLQAAARAERENSAQLFFQAALCALQGSEAAPADPQSAKVWMTKAAAMQHVAAHRMLASMQAAEQAAQTHERPARHCHALGEGRELCHGAP
jgi:TPR repeat protein